MSKGKATPGPWEIHYEVGVHNHDWSLQNGERAFLLFNQLADLPEAKANARLIAAAPEMLAELKRIYSLYGHQATADVIAKAEGLADKDQGGE